MAVFAHLNSLEFITLTYYHKLLDILTHGDIHPNPGPSSPLFQFMHWNLNSIPAHDYERILILEAFATQEKLKLIAITETALKNTIPDDKVNIDGYSLIRNDLPPSDRCGGVALFYQNDLSVKNRCDLQIPNTIVAEISFSRKKIFFIVSYRNQAKLLPNSLNIVINLMKF